MKIRLMACTVLLIGIATGMNAQQSRSSREILQRAAASVNGRDIVTAVHVYQGSVTEASHTHPGDLSGYVLEGTLTLFQQGLPTQTFNACQTFFVPAGIRHHMVSAGDARLVATYFVEQDKPLAAGAN